LRSTRKLRRDFGLLLLADAGALVLGDYGRECITVDRRLDAGHVYDYRAGRCRDDVTHLPYMSYAARRPAVIAGVGALAISDLGLIVLGWRDK
jgi:hypothetical protein